MTKTGHTTKPGRPSEATFVVVLDNYTRKVNSPCHCATCERDKNAAYAEVLRLFREAL